MMLHFATVIRGKGKGKKLGFPTINLKIEDKINLSGVFAGSLEIDGKIHDGVIFVGKAKTFNRKEKTIEIHLFDFDIEIKENTKAFLSFGKKIREIQKFSSEEELKKAISKDCEMAYFMAK